MLEAGKFDLEIIDFGPTKTVEEDVVLLLPIAQDKGIDLSASLEPAIADPGPVAPKKTVPE